MHAACAQGVKWRWLTTNPVVNTSPPKLRHQTKQVPTPEMVQRLIRGAEQEDPDMAVRISLGAITGARRGELCGLKWGDVDFEGRTLTISRSLEQTE
jgi:integrase